MPSPLLSLTERADAPLVVVVEWLCALVEKGEMTPRYYNPGNYFKEVHLVSFHDTKESLEILRKKIQPMVGDAHLIFLHFTLPDRLFHLTLGYRPFLLKKWASCLRSLFAQIKPCLVRGSGVSVPNFLASEAARAENIPFVVSLHGNPDVDYFRGRRANTFKKRLQGMASESMEIQTVKNAAMVLPVYSPIVPFLEKHHISHYTIIYNAVALEETPKEEIEPNPKEIRLLCVGRQQSMEKDPSALIDLVAADSNFFLTLVGTGDLHEDLKKHAIRLKIEDRITFIPHLLNKDVLKLMKKSDFFVYASHNYEISKSCIEASLLKLPVILNNRRGQPARELVEAGFFLVEGTTESYAEALKILLKDPKKRQQQVQHSFHYAKKNCAPEQMEQKVVDIYRKLLQ